MVEFINRFLDYCIMGLVILGSLTFLGLVAILLGKILALFWLLLFGS